MTSLITVFAPNSVLNSENNDKEMFAEQERMYEKLYQKIEYYYSASRTIISRDILNEIIEAYNQRGRINTKFMEDANGLKDVEFWAKTNVCSMYIELAKAHNEQLSLIVENLENAIRNESTKLNRTQ